jgi:LmbE family N-acetylglucosaminyl deacetylase
VSAVIVAPHPDDEVLGAAGVLRTDDCVVIHVSAGVPPWTPPSERAILAADRLRECQRAWSSLGAKINRTEQLGFDDLGVSNAVDALSWRLTDVLGQLQPATVYVPAFQQGHPDHDATFAAALLARIHNPARHQWRVYGLYGYDPMERLAFGLLDPKAYPDAVVVDDTPGERLAKAQALSCFESQLRPGSIVQRWIDDPFPEGRASLPMQMPHASSASFYDAEFDFAPYGISAKGIRSTLEAALAARSAPERPLSPRG